MAVSSIPNSFTNGTNADANLVNANFAYLSNWLNNYVIQPDVANFTVFPTLPSSTPTSPYQAVHKAYIDSFLPSGMIVQYVGTVAPSGWRFCDGSTYNGSDPTYAKLWTAIGIAYGGSDVTNFKVPDLRGRVPVGYGAGTGLTNRVIGATGGEEGHLLTAAESGVPAHSHSASTTVTVDGVGDHDHAFNNDLGNHTNNIPARQTSSTSHTHTGTSTVAAGMSGTDVTIESGRYKYTLFDDAQPAGAHAHTASATTSVTANANNDAASTHNNMQPFVVVSYIIKL